MLQGEWKSDGLDADGKASWSATEDRELVVLSDESAATGSTTSSPKIISIDSTGGSPLNLCFSLTSPQPKYYFHIGFVEASSSSTSLSIGVVRPSEFKKGWGTKGLFYNGNLTNGSAALKAGYGPYLKQGDIAIVEYTESENAHQVNFHVNGTCLGTGFEIPKESSSCSEESFIPCLKGQGGLKVRAMVLVESPKNEVAVKAPHPLHGKWTLLKAYEPSEATRQIWPVDSRLGTGTSERRTITLDLEPYTSFDTENCWTMVLKAWNTMRVTKIVSQEIPANAYLLTVPQMTSPGHVVSSTKMMPPPPFDEVEQKLSSALGSYWQKLKLDDAGHLRALMSDGTILADLVRQHRDSSAPACTSYS